MKRFIELFSGSNRLTDELRKRGLQGISIDWDEKTKADFHLDISKISYEDLVSLLGEEPGFVWASPDCTSYSIAQHGLHRGRGGIPVSDYANFSDKMNENLWMNILAKCHCPYIVENPRGHYRQMSFVKSPFRLTVLYGDYGLTYPKPTDYFYNDFAFRAWIKYPNDYRKGGNLSNEAHGCLGRSFVPQDLINTLADYIEGILKNE